MPASSVMVPTTPQFVALKQVLERWDAAKTALEEAKIAEEALSREAYAIATSIRMQNVIDDNYELAPTFIEGKSVEKIDSDRIRLNHPDIYDKCNPHISKNDMGTMLLSVHSPEELQEMFKTMNKGQWYQLSRITKADLQKATSRPEWRMLEEEGAIFTEMKFGGEIKILNKHFQAVLESQKPGAGIDLIEEAD